jgi:hypothetical protein
MIQFIRRYCSDLGHMVAQLVKARRYKPEGRRFNPLG